MVNGAKIKRLRESLSLTQTELGEAVGVSQAAINQFENGLKDPKILTLWRIAEKLGCKVDDLIIKT